MRTITLKEFMLEELNRQLEESGRDVRIVSERPKPTLVAEVIELRKPQPVAAEQAT
ncbi:MAG: hypothetical protein WBF73_26765 [Bradyrhizobium sp.]